MFANNLDKIVAGLEALIEDRDDFSRTTAVRAIFRRDPLHAYDRLAPFFARDDIAARAIGKSILKLLAFAPWGSDRNEVRSWLEQDPRWLTLCAELCPDENHGRSATYVLCSAEPASALEALAAVQDKRAPAPVEVTQARGDLVARYRAGDHFGAWRDARAFPAIAGALREEIIALAHETMERVAHNADLISERLQRAGWGTIGPMRTKPEAGDVDTIATIEKMTGAPLPPSLLAFWRVVGGINWVWDWDLDYRPVIEGLPLTRIETDALAIEPCSGVEHLCFDMWEDQKSVIHPDLVGPFDLLLAPDLLTKGNGSGGRGYVIELPFAGADPLFRQDEAKLPFVDYLRDCFNWAGFPHLKYYEDRSAALQFVKAFGAGLEPF